MTEKANPIIGYPYQAPFSTLSAISCSFMISLSLLYRKQLFDQYETKLVIILLIFYDGLCLSSLLPVYEFSTNSNEIFVSNCTIAKSSPDMEDNRDGLCNLQGFLIQFFSLSGIIWTGFINFVNYRGIISKKEVSQYKLPLIITIVFGLITSAVPLAGVGYQESTCWCWFNISKSSNDMDHLKRFYWVGFFYAIAWIIIVFIVYAFVRTWLVLKKKGADQSKYKKTLYIPIILFFCFIPLTISRSIAITGKSSCGLLGFSIFSSCLMRSLGFLNSLVYGYHSNIRTIFFEVYGCHQDNSEPKKENPDNDPDVTKSLKNPV